MNTQGSPNFSPSPIPQAEQQLPVPSTSREPLRSIPPPRPFNQLRSRLTTKRGRKIPEVGTSKGNNKRQKVVESSSDSENELLEVIKQTHKENMLHKDAKVVAGMVETFLIDNPVLIPKFRLEICLESEQSHSVTDSK